MSASVDPGEFGWCIRCAKPRRALGPQGLCGEHFIAEYEPEPEPVTEDPSPC